MLDWARKADNLEVESLFWRPVKGRGVRLLEGRRLIDKACWGKFLGHLAGQSPTFGRLVAGNFWWDHAAANLSTQAPLESLRSHFGLRIIVQVRVLLIQKHDLSTPFEPNGKALDNVERLGLEVHVFVTPGVSHPVVY